MVRLIRESLLIDKAEDLDNYDPASWKAMIVGRVRDQGLFLCFTI
jgi:hypothetical protein